MSYKATISIESKEAFYSFYFKDKKLTRFTLTSEAFSTDINISYGKTIPQLPHNPKLDEEAMATEMVESISLADTNFVQVRIDNPTSQGNKIEHLEFSPSICHY
ncbi:MAG: hypothetical protein MJ233_04735 [Mycoplasmoidaceae bacterium]|nr:hypothetical protein [Mycoplasmoidaceae bacterium]